MYRNNTQQSQLSCRAIQVPIIMGSNTENFKIGKVEMTLVKCPHTPHTPHTMRKYQITVKNEENEKKYQIRPYYFKPSSSTNVVALPCFERNSFKEFLQDNKQFSALLEFKNKTRIYSSTISTLRNVMKLSKNILEEDHKFVLIKKNHISNQQYQHQLSFIEKLFYQIFEEINEMKCNQSAEQTKFLIDLQKYLISKGYDLPPFQLSTSFQYKKRRGQFQNLVFWKTKKISKK